MIIGFTGKVGSGKTLLMTYFLNKYYKRNWRVMTNYGLTFKHEKANFSAFQDLKIDLNHVALGIDEIHLWMDSRTSMKKRNRVFSYFITQSRKRNLIFYWTSQRFGQIDKRLRENTDYLFECKKYKSGNKVIIRASMTDMDSGKTKKITLKANPIFKLYDSHEIINPVDDDSPGEPEPEQGQGRGRGQKRKREKRTK